MSDCWNAFASFRFAFVSISSFGIILKENEFPNCWFRIAKITAWFLYFSLIFSRESLVFSKSTDECSYWGILKCYYYWNAIVKKTMKNWRNCSFIIYILIILNNVLLNPSCPFIWEKRIYCIPGQFIVCDVFVIQVVNIFLFFFAYSVFCDPLLPLKYFCL